MTSSWFFLSTLNYDARSTTHQIYTCTWMGLPCVAGCSGRASKTGALVGNSDYACLSTASLVARLGCADSDLRWDHLNAITEILYKQRTSILRAMLNRRGQTLTRSTNCASWFHVFGDRRYNFRVFFLRNCHCGIIEMKTVRTGALLIPICDAQQQESQDEEIRNEVKSAFQRMPLLKYSILLRLRLQGFQIERGSGGQ